MGSVTKQGVTWQFVINTGLDGTGRRTQLRRRGFAPEDEAAGRLVCARQDSNLQPLDP